MVLIEGEKLIVCNTGYTVINGSKSRKLGPSVTFEKKRIQGLLSVLERLPYKHPNYTLKNRLIEKGSPSQTCKEHVF